MSKVHIFYIQYALKVLDANSNQKVPLMNEKNQT